MCTRHINGRTEGTGSRDYAGDVRILQDQSVSLETNTYAYDGKVKEPAVKSLKQKTSYQTSSATLTWGKVSGTTGYEVYRASSKNGKYKKLKAVNKKTTSYTKSKLTKGKKYYFKVRTYRTVSGKKVYSSWSAVKNVKVK